MSQPSKRHLEPSDEGTKKRLKWLLPGLLSRHGQLYEQIQLLPDQPTNYSDPNKVLDLPFPSTNLIPARFALSNGARFSYMGRECFVQVWDAFLTIKRRPHHRQAIYVHGCKGIGKSHILAALACLLIRNGKQVVYLPYCRAMLHNPVNYLREALMFAFAKSKPSIYNDLEECETVESLADFCVEYRKRGQLCFIMDQMDALDLLPLGHDDVDNDRKVKLRTSLNRMTVGHIQIASAAADHKTFRYMATRETGELKVHLMGGMTLSEMSCWWKHHDFPAFSEMDKLKVEDLTGCIPLLLDPFVKHHDKTQSLEISEPKIWRSEVLAAAINETVDFANAKRSELGNKIFFDDFVPEMRKFLSGHTRIAGSGPHIDHRYFYLSSEGYGRYSCGLAREAMSTFLEKQKEL